MKEISSLLKETKHVVIISHKDPDGDALGSQFGLGLALEENGKTVRYLNLGEVPSFLSFLPGTEKLEQYQGQQLEKDALLIYVDCADSHRAGFPILPGITVNIDHHVSNDFFATYNLVDTAAAATGEIIYYLLQDAGYPISPSVATNLYTALSMDTGSFLYSNTTAQTHRIAADLIAAGADTGAIRDNVFEGMSLKRFELLRYAYREIRLGANNRIASVALPFSVIQSLEAKNEDTDGLVSHLRNIKDVEVAILLKEREDGRVKGSLRSKSIVDVSAFAGRFGGGGHKRAAGFETDLSLEEIQNRILAEMEKELSHV